MPAPMVKTGHPGIFKRGKRYVAVYRDAQGVQHKEAARTLDDARRIKRKRDSEADSGAWQADSRATFHDFAREWIERYQGTGRSGFRERTRDDYRRSLEMYALKYFGPKVKLAEIGPKQISGFIAWLCDEKKQGQALKDSTVRNQLAPVRACFSTAVREGAVQSNPCTNAKLPSRPSFDEEDEEDVRALTREQLATFLTVVHPRHRLLFEFLASTGLRFSEVAALQWKHLRLDGSEPHVRVRRGIVKGTYDAPKSKQSRRDIPIGASLVSALRGWHKATEWPGADDLVFPTLTGGPMNYSNMRQRVLQPAAEEAGAPWAGFHAFRHSAASILFARGDDLKQVQRVLGHASPAFTLKTYIHLLGDKPTAPIDLEAELSEGQGGNQGATEATELSGTQ